MIIFGFIQRQPDIGFKREMVVSNRKGKFPTGDWSFDDGGGEGPSAAEVATSFPARLLGAIEELWKFLNS